MPLELQKSFRLYVTHVDGEGQLLKICGQLDQPSSLMVESLFQTARDDLEQGIGSVPPGAIQDGIICAAKYKDGAYYRAKIISTTNLSTGLVGVYFIDFGNKDVIPLNAIRLLDNFDPMFLRLPGLVNEYFLARFMHPSGRWDDALLLMLQNLLCYAEHPVTIEGLTNTLPIISLQLKGTDLSSHLIAKRIGVAVPVPKQRMMLAHPGGDIVQATNWQQNFMFEFPSYTEHVPILVNQNVSPNPASAPCLQQTVPFSGPAVTPPSAIFQRLKVNKSARDMANLRAPIRQLWENSNFPPILEGSSIPIAPATNRDCLFPKKSTSFKSHMLECNAEHKVFVSFVEDGPELFTVQLMTDIKRFQNMMNDINRRPHISLTEPPMIGTVCLGRISEDRIICRSIVMNLSGSQCKLYFVDLGDTEMVSYYDVFEIPEEFMKPDVFALRFCLSGVKKLEKSPYLDEVFKKLVCGKVMKLRVVAPEGPPLIQYGELYLDNKNVLDLLLANMKDKLQFKWMDMLQLGSQYSVLVSYVDSCLKFYVQLSDQIDDLNAVMDAVKAHCESSSSPGELPVGAVCCARFADDGNWYRAYVCSIKDNKKVVVTYVDYGNAQEVAVSDLRTITPDLMKLPAQALKCALKGFENRPVETKTSEQLETLVLEKTLIAHIVAVVSGDTMLVTLTDDTVFPPLDVAQGINDLLQPKINQKMDVTAPVAKRAPEAYCPPEGGAGDSAHRKSSPTDERRRDLPEELRPRAGCWRNRRGKPWGPGAPVDDWRAALEPRRAIRVNSENSSNKQDEWEEKKPEERASGARFERREPREPWADKKEFPRREFRERGDRPRGGGGGGGGGFTPRDRAERSFGSDKSAGSGKERAGRAPPHKPRGPFTHAHCRELAEPVPLDTPFAEPAVEPGAQHEVAVTWIISPQSFYTQILAHQPRFLEMMHRIPELYKGVRSYCGPVGVGASVLARYPADGVLYRATVVAVQPLSKFVVQYVDFGNKQLVDAKDVWQLERQLMELPRMAVHCCLLGVAPPAAEWKADPEVDLCFNAPRYQCVFAESADGQQRVSLWSNGASVADALVAKGLAARADPPPAVTLKDEAVDLTIIVGQQIPCRVTHVHSFDKFYVQLDLEKAALVEQAVAACDAALLTPLAADSLADGVHCTVRHEGRVFRAILNDTADAARVAAVLPDYGRTITTSLDHLMVLPTELSVYYYQSLECCLNNYSAESRRLLSEEGLKARLVDHKFIVYVDSVEGISLVTTLYDLATGQKLALFEPDEGAFEEVSPLCPRTVFNYNFGLASVQHLERLDEIYLQRCADVERVQALLESLFAFYEEGAPEPLTEFAADTLCAAKSADENWYRAVIVSASDDAATVQFPDYGNSETVPKAQLRKLDPRFHEPCAQALVAGLGLEALQESALARLAEWTAEQEVQVTLACGADGWLASLHLDGVDLSMRLVDEKLAAPEPAAAPAPPPPGCTQVYISHIDTPGHFWLQPADKVARIDEIQAELQAHAADYPELARREVGTLCAAKYSADEQWYRAQVLDLDADITTVRFVDYGNTDVLDNQPGVVRQLPEALAAVEPLALRSSVNAVPTGTGQWSEPAADSFAALVGDTEAPVAALVVLTDETTYVDLFVGGENLTDRLVAQGHAARAEQPECGDLPACFASHVNSPSEFWLQLESAAPELQAMEAAMVDAERFPALPSREEGVLCAAKYPEDEAWYRAQVIVDGSEGTEVLFMDYGNASIATELRSLPAELRGKPALSRKCALQKPRDIKAWSRKSETKFTELAAEGATVFKVQFIAAGDVSIVELFLDGRSVTEQLVGLCEERPPAPRPPPEGRATKTSEKTSQDAEATVPFQVETEVLKETNLEIIDTEKALIKELDLTDNNTITIASKSMTVSEGVDSAPPIADSVDISSVFSASKSCEPVNRNVWKEEVDLTATSDVTNQDIEATVPSRISEPENFKESIPETMETDCSETLRKEVDASNKIDLSVQVGESVAQLTDTDKTIQTEATYSIIDLKVDLATLTSNDDDTMSVLPTSKCSEHENENVSTEEVDLTATSETNLATEVAMSSQSESEALSKTIHTGNTEALIEELDFFDKIEGLYFEESVALLTNTDKLIETEATSSVNVSIGVDSASNGDVSTSDFSASKCSEAENVNVLLEELYLSVTPEATTHDTQAAVSSQISETEDLKETIAESKETDSSEAFLEEINPTNKIDLSSEKVVQSVAQLTDTDKPIETAATGSITTSKDPATLTYNDESSTSVFSASLCSELENVDVLSEELNLSVTPEVTTYYTDAAVSSQISEKEDLKETIPESNETDGSEALLEEIDSTNKIEFLSEKVVEAVAQLPDTDKPIETAATSITTTKGVYPATLTYNDEDITSVISTSKCSEPENVNISSETVDFNRDTDAAMPFHINESEDIKNAIAEITDTKNSEALQKIDSTNKMKSEQIVALVAQLKDTDKPSATEATESIIVSKVLDPPNPTFNDDNISSILSASKPTEPENVNDSTGVVDFSAESETINQDTGAAVSQICGTGDLKVTMPESIQTDTFEAYETDLSMNAVESVDLLIGTDISIETAATGSITVSKIVESAPLTSYDEYITSDFSASKYSKPGNVNVSSEEADFIITLETTGRGTDAAVPSHISETVNLINTNNSEALREDVDSANKMEGEPFTDFVVQLTDINKVKGIVASDSITVSKAVDFAMPISSHDEISSVFSASKPPEELDFTVTSEMTAVPSQFCETGDSKQTNFGTVDTKISKVLPEQIDTTYKIDTNNCVTGLVERLSETNKPSGTVATDTITILKEDNTAASSSNDEDINSVSKPSETENVSLSTEKVYLGATFETLSKDTDGAPNLQNSETEHLKRTIPVIIVTDCSEGVRKEIETTNKTDLNAQVTISGAPPNDTDEPTERVDPEYMTLIEEKDLFEDNMNSSDSKLDEIWESLINVFENISLEANSETLDGTSDKTNQQHSTNEDIASDVFEKSGDTIKTPDKNESKESVNTDTGYTSSDAPLSKDNSPFRDQPDRNPSSTLTMENKSESDENKIEGQTNTDTDSIKKDLIGVDSGMTNN